MNSKGFSIPKLFADAPDVDSSSKSINDTYITPISVQALLEKLWKNDKRIMDLLHGSNGKATSPAMFFLNVVAVTPTRFRPVSKMNGKLFEHPQNIYLSEIIKSNMQIQDIQQVENKWLESASEDDAKVMAAKKDDFFKRKIEAWIKLQESVNYLIDSSKAPLAKGMTVFFK